VVIDKNGNESLAFHGGQLVKTAGKIDLERPA